MLKTPLSAALICAAFPCFCLTACAQTATPPQTVSPAPPPKRYRFYSEDIIAVGFSVDLNPNDKVIFYPSIGIDYVFPELGLNVRGAGSRYLAAGIAQNVFVAPPIFRLSYGQQWRHSFIELGMIAVAKGEYGHVEWSGQNVFPRLAFGARF